MRGRRERQKDRERWEREKREESMMSGEEKG